MQRERVGEGKGISSISGSPGRRLFQDTHAGCAQHTRESKPPRSSANLGCNIHLFGNIRGQNAPFQRRDASPRSRDRPGGDEPHPASPLPCPRNLSTSSRRASVLYTSGSRKTWAEESKIKNSISCYDRRGMNAKIATPRLRTLSRLPSSRRASDRRDVK